MSMIKRYLENATGEIERLDNLIAEAMAVVEATVGDVGKSVGTVAFDASASAQLSNLLAAKKRVIETIFILSDDRWGGFAG